MNCQTFEYIVNLLAAEEMMDAVERDAALAHAAACGHCAVRLMDERALSSDLRYLAVQMESVGASPEVAERLMASFDARGLVPMHSSATRRWVYAASAIAAALVLAIGLGALRMRAVTPSGPPDRTAVASNSVSPSITVAVVPPADALPGVRPSVPSPPKPNRNRHRLPPRITNASADVSSKEVATDFIPVMYGRTDIEPGSQIVRVELPRSAMASFGLPVNMDRADQLVKADVLLGVDGLAHAIRFVR